MQKQAVGEIQRKDLLGCTDLGHSRWKLCLMPDRVKNVRKWNAENLFLTANYQPKILLQIHHINFPLLTILNLASNRLFSIQMIYTIDAPNLKQLILCDNELFNADCLRKGAFPELTSLHLGTNYIGQYHRLTEIAADNLNTLSADYSATTNRFTLKFPTKIFTSSSCKTFYNKIHELPQRVTKAKIHIKND